MHDAFNECSNSDDHLRFDVHNDSAHVVNALLKYIPKAGCWVKPG